MPTDTQRRARNKWDAENMSVISCKLKREIAETFKATAKANGTTPNELTRKWIDAYMRQNMPAEQPSAEKIWFECKKARPERNAQGGLLCARRRAIL